MSEFMNLQDIEARFPAWVPKEIFPYLAHTEAGTSLRALARDAGVHASTVMRQVHALEARREDALVDRVLNRFGKCVKKLEMLGDGGVVSSSTRTPERDLPDSEADKIDLTDQRFGREAQRVLVKLCEPGAVMAVADDMDKAVIVRETDEGDTTRRGILDKDVAEALALKSWISCDKAGRIARYRITMAGRSALRGLVADAENKAVGLDGDQPMDLGVDSRLADKRASGMAGRRFHAADTPLALLGRRHDKTGQKFLSPDLISMGERLREDFELSGCDVDLTMGWDHVLSALQSQKGDSSKGTAMARDRVLSALRDLGPGLGDAALRCCCLLEGLETTEKKMGWSARSGKIVLRIALQRLKRHYDSLGEAGALLG